MDRTTVVVAACAGAAVCAGVYVLWGPENFFRPKVACSGLSNLGNTCFMNAVLQALAPLPGLREWLGSVAARHRGRLAAAMEQVLTVLSDGRAGVYAPVEVLQALRFHLWTLNSEQQDALELFHVLLTTVGEELDSCPSLLAGLLPLLQDEEGAANKTIALTRTGRVPGPEKQLVCPLQGLLSSELHCYHCLFSFPTKFETFDSLSLTLPRSPEGQCTLHSCLLDFVKSEVVTEVECPQCSKKAGHKIKRTFLKKLQLGRPPDLLCIHFNRTLWLSDGSLYKNDILVSFSVDFDASELLKRSSAQSQLTYKLCAVIEHCGSPHSGHYITYRRASGNRRRWVYTSDTTVYAVSIHTVLKSQAYMLFYQRR